MKTPRWPTQCALCQGWGWSRLCEACVEWHAPARRRCPRCAIRVADAVALCGHCLRQPPPHDGALAAVDYAPPWSGLLARFKFQAALDLSEALVDRLVDAGRRDAPGAPGLLLPVPSSAERLRERGYNPAWELARRLARRLGAVASASLLLRVRHTPRQLSLPLAERQANVRGAFAVEPLRRALLRDRDVTVVDDVMTTGATFDEITRVLRAAGTARVQVWALARTPEPGS